MMDLRKEMNIVDWLTLLATFCQPADIPASIESLCHLVPHLRHFPDYAFCISSARHVEATERRRAHPSLGEIEGPLRGWLDRNERTPEQRQRQVDQINAENAERRRLAGKAT